MKFDKVKDKLLSSQKKSKCKTNSEELWVHWSPQTQTTIRKSNKHGGQLTRFLHRAAVSTEKCCPGSQCDVAHLRRLTVKLPNLSKTLTAAEHLERFYPQQLKHRQSSGDGPGAAALWELMTHHSSSPWFSSLSLWELITWANSCSRK